MRLWPRCSMQAGEVGQHGALSGRADNAGARREYAARAAGGRGGVGRDSGDVKAVHRDSAMSAAKALRYSGRMDLKRLPKVELHLHLDCSLSYKAVARLAPAVTREEYLRDYVAPARCTNLADFLARAPKGFRLMQSEAALRAVTEDVFEQLVDDGVVYAEIRFAPLLHMEQGLTAERVVAVVERAADELVRATGVEAGLILCTLRHFTAEQSMETARLVEQFRGSRVVALDIAGDEAGFPLDAHVAAYRFAREHGLARTAHAGEACGPAERVGDAAAA